MSEHMLDDGTEESGADTCAICLARVAADEAFLDRCYHRFHFQVRQQTRRVSFLLVSVHHRLCDRSASCVGLTPKVHILPRKAHCTAAPCAKQHTPRFCMGYMGRPLGERSVVHELAICISCGCDGMVKGQSKRAKVLQSDHAFAHVS